MTTIKAKELRELPSEELEEKIVSMKNDLSKEKAQISSGTKAENPGKIKKLRREIARVFTVINEKKNNKPALTEKKQEPETKNKEKKKIKKGSKK